MTATTHVEAIAQVARRSRRRPRLIAYWLIFPILLYEGVFILFPIYEGLKLSLYRQKIGRPPRWVGLDNYTRLLHDEDFWHVMRTTVLFMLAVIVIAVGFGLFSALVLNQAIRGRVIARAMMTAPWAFPDVPTVLVFLWMLNPNFGVMNVFAEVLPGVNHNLTWLLDRDLAFVSVVIATAWKGFPFYSLVILAALQTVPPELTEAARVDGASRVQAFWAVTLPAISPTLLLLTVLASIYSFKQFTLIWLLAGVGPSNSTETVVIRIYQEAFRFHDFAYASTYGVAGFVLAMAISLVFLAIQRRQEQEVAS